MKEELSALLDMYAEQIQNGFSSRFINTPAKTFRHHFLPIEEVWNVVRKIMWIGYHLPNKKIF